MKKRYLYIVVSLFFFSCNTPNLKLSAMTYNVRYGLADDGENSWEFRKENMASLIRFYQPDIFGTQEGLPFQVNFLEKSLPNYKFVGTDRDGNGKGESTAIFYNTSKFKVLETQTFWLAPNQEKLSRAWDAAFPRIYTYGLFEHIKTKKKFWIINTHFDHIGLIARENSAKIILNKIKSLNIDNYPLIFMGDLNSEPDSKPVLILKTELYDSKEISLEKPFGPKGTFNAFQFNVPVTKKIDYIFISKNKTITVNKYAVLSDSNDLKYPSDHLPVYVELQFNK